MKTTRVDLTEQQYDIIVGRYEKTGDAKDLKILQNCTILMEQKPTVKQNETQEPFGLDWEKGMMLLTKTEIVDLYRKVCVELHEYKMRAMMP